MRPSQPVHQREAVIMRSWRIEDGGWRAQVRLDMPGKSTSRSPIAEVRIAYPPRDGSHILVRESRGEGWVVVD